MKMETIWRSLQCTARDFTCPLRTSWAYDLDARVRVERVQVDKKRKQGGQNVETVEVI